MAEYKGIKGFKVQSLASDPSPAVVGQVWYNTAGSALKYTSEVGSWFSGGDLNTIRQAAGAAGTTAVSLVISGINPPATVTEVESYDGTTWTERGDVNAARGSAASGGIQTAAMLAGGGTVALAEQFDGTTWTETTSMTTGKKCSGGGTTTSFLAFAKGPPPSTTNESWNGTSWTEIVDLNSTRYYASGVGASNTDALCVGGQEFSPPQYVANVEQWNGTSWTALNPMNSGRSTLGTAGTTTLALAYGGGSPASALTESFDGTSWTEVADLATARYGVSLNCSTQSSTIAFCTSGTPIPGVGDTTEEWAMASTTKTVTTS